MEWIAWRRSIIALFTCGLLVWGGCKMVQEKFRSSQERIVFEQGSGPGQLFFPSDDTSPALPMPSKLAVGSAGEISILDPELARIQGFSADGKFLSALTLADIGRFIGMIGKENQMNIINVFSKEYYTAVALVSTETSEISKNSYWFVKYRTDTAEILSYEIIPSLSDSVNLIYASFLDLKDRLWVFTNQWSVYDIRRGNIATLGADGSFVDRNGSLYVGDETIKVMDYRGMLQTTLEVKPKEEVEIDGGEAESLLFSWERNLETVRTPESVAFPNILNLYQIDKKTQCLVLKTRMELPSSRLYYPGPNPDFAVPVEFYINDSAVLREGYFYILAYSTDKYWLDKYDFRYLIQR